MCIRDRALSWAKTADGLMRSSSASAERLIGELPNVDFALTAVAACARLPADAPLVLFALARSVGWIAHAFEQRQTGTLLRPRARYTGPAIPPGAASSVR